jgi:hypothetical protein
VPLSERDLAEIAEQEADGDIFRTPRKTLTRRVEEYIARAHEGLEDRNED